MKQLLQLVLNWNDIVFVKFSNKTFLMTVFILATYIIELLKKYYDYINFQYLYIKFSTKVCSENLISHSLCKFLYGLKWVSTKVSTYNIEF